MRSLYQHPAWRRLRKRVIERDNSLCLFHRLGGCEGPLHVHHFDRSADPLDGEKCVTVCRKHHPMVEAVQRRAQRHGEWKRCTRHNHPYREGRIQCEAKLNGVPRDQVAA